MSSDISLQVVSLALTRCSGGRTMNSCLKFVINSVSYFLVVAQTVLCFVEFACSNQILYLDITMAGHQCVTKLLQLSFGEAE